MKFQRNLALLATTSMLVLSVGCNDRFQEGLSEGKKQGYTEGYEVGYKDGDKNGFARAQEYFASADYTKGFNDGKAQGLELGYSNGYTKGKADGTKQGYDYGYADGYKQGDKDGYNDGYTDGYNVGVDEGFDYGYTDGLKDGYDIGYKEGFNDGYYGLSVGKTQKLKGYADILSIYHNELFDYSKIKAPVQTKHGLVANGQLLLSETSTTNKDTLKKAAVVEQYLVIEMAKQVKSKFGLSDERSIKIAKASNHFRKFASKRALTTEDSNAYAVEMMGADFSEIDSAYRSSLKGQNAELNSLLEKAAEKNETTPEKMGEIFTKLFN